MGGGCAVWKSAREEPSADDEITGFPEAMNTGAGKETDVLFAPEQTKTGGVSAKEGRTKQVTLSIGQGKRDGFIRKDPRGGRRGSFPYRFRGI